MVKYLECLDPLAVGLVIKWVCPHKGCGAENCDQDTSQNNLLKCFACGKLVKLDSHKIKSAMKGVKIIK